VQLYDKDGNLMNIPNAKASYTFVSGSAVTTTREADKCGNGILNNPGTLTDYCEATSSTAGLPALEIKLSACLHGLSRVVVHVGLRDSDNTKAIQMDAFEAAVSWRGAAYQVLSTPAFTNNDATFSYNYPFTPGTYV
jgi:hypothetical protein